MVIPMSLDHLTAETKADLAVKFAALSNPTRLRILEILAEHPESIVSDLVERLPLSQATVSQHLSVLQKAGLVFHEPSGVRRCCWIDLDALAAFTQHVVGWSYALATRTAKTCSEGDPLCTS